MSYVYVVSRYSDGAVSHVDKWRCFRDCETCTKRFVCYTHKAIERDVWNLGRSWGVLSYMGTVGWGFADEAH